MPRWVPDGEREVLAERWGKYLALQRFEDEETGETTEYAFCGQGDYVVVFPVVEVDGVLHVIAQKAQWRFGAQQECPALPAGTLTPEDATSVDAATRLLEARSDYRATEMINLGTQYLNVANSDTEGTCFLAIGCEPTGTSDEDASEFELIPISEWHADYMPSPDIQINDCTVRALLDLGYEFVSEAS